MHDLIWAFAVIGGLSFLLYRGSRFLTRQSSDVVSTAVAFFASAFLVSFGLLVHGKLMVARWLPLSNAIILGNALPLAAAVLCGVLVGRPTIPRWRSAPLAAFLLAGTWWSVLINFLPSPVASEDRWTAEGVCLQTSEASCSAAAAATLLRHHGIVTAEAEMMRLCLTRSSGTPSLGMYRGLKLKTQGTEWRVQIVRGTARQLLDQLNSPVLLRMRLPREPSWVGRLLGWTGLLPDPGHAVVLFEATDDGRLWVADPSTGKHRWRAEDFLPRWRGEGVRLVRRNT